LRCCQSPQACTAFAEIFLCLNSASWTSKGYSRTGLSLLQSDRPLSVTVGQASLWREACPTVTLGCPRCASGWWTKSGPKIRCLYDLFRFLYSCHI
jgi:hypothetical protein